MLEATTTTEERQIQIQQKQHAGAGVVQNPAQEQNTGYKEKKAGRSHMTERGASNMRNNENSDMTGTKEKDKQRPVVFRKKSSKAVHIRENNSPNYG